MIMKKFILFIMLAFASFGAFAQTAIESQKVLDNVYVGVSGGVTTPLDFNSMFPVNATAGLKLGKEFSPVFGLEVEDFVSFGDNHFMNSKTFVKTNNLFLNGRVNLSNLLCDYKGFPRKFELYTNTGLGWQHRYGINSTDDDEFLAKTGLDFAFNFKDVHSFVISPAVYWNLTNKHDALTFSKHHAQLGISVGYVYHFPTSNGTHSFKMYDIGAYEGIIAKLNNDLSKKPKEVIKEKVVEKVITTSVNSNFWIPFAFDKAELSDNAKEILKSINGTVNVDGYASWEDGSNAEHNQRLSAQRADAVANYLRTLGVSVNRCEGHGAENVTSQRCVVVSLVK